MGKLLSWLGWLFVALIGASAFAWLALSRGERVSAAWLVTAAVCTYLIAYRFYSRFIATKIFALDANRDDAGRAAQRRSRLRADESLDRVRPPLRGHRRSRAARRADARGAVRVPARRDLDHRRRRARRRGPGLRDPLRRRCAATESRSGRWRRRRSARSPGYTALVAVLGIMIVLIAVLALVVVNALGESPWGVVTVGLTIPIALLMGGYLRWIRPHRVLEATRDGPRAADRRAVRRARGRRESRRSRRCSR